MMRPQTKTEQMDIFFVRWMTLVVCVGIMCLLLGCIWPGLDWALLIFASLIIPPVISFRKELVKLYYIWKDYIRGNVPREQDIEE